MVRGSGGRPFQVACFLTAAMWGLCAVNIVLFSLFIR
jgi:hypothetical protein